MTVGIDMPHRRLWIYVVGVIAVLVIDGCSEPKVRSIGQGDSGQWTTDTEWRLSAAPRVTISGKTEGHELSYITGAALLSDGRVVVSDRSVPIVSVYSPAGEYLGDIGREGRGPGEYEVPYLLQLLPGDLVVIRDGPAHRITVFTSEGQVERMLGPRVVMEGVIWTGLGLFPDGTLLAKRLSYGAPGLPGTTMQMTAEVVRLDSTGQELTRYGEYPAEVWMNQALDSETTIQGRRYFGWKLEIATDGRAVVLGPSRAYHLDRFSVDGEPMAPIKREMTPRLVTEADRDLIREQMEILKAVPLASAPERFADTLPLFGRLVFDSEGYLWVATYAERWQSPELCSVFSATGEWLGDVRMPPGFTPLAIGEDYVVGVSRDEDDIPNVSVFDLDRRRNPGSY